MKNIVLIVGAVVLLGILALPADVFGTSDCDDPRCYAQLKTIRTAPINGLQFDLDSPSIFVNRDPAVCENFVASGGWMVAEPRISERGFEWIETGVTSGFIKNSGCTSILSAYYGFNLADTVGSNYQELRFTEGRVDPENDITIKMQKHVSLPGSIQVFLTTPDFDTVNLTVSKQR